MQGEFFQDYFSPPQQLSSNVGNVVILTTNQDGTTLLVFVNGELSTYDQRKSPPLRLLDKAHSQTQNTHLLMNASGTYFFFLQHIQEPKIQIYRRRLKNWTFHKNIQLQDNNIVFFVVSHSGNLLLTNQYHNAYLYEYNGEHKKRIRVQHLNTDAQSASINESENVIALKAKSTILLLKRKDQMFVKYESIKTESESHHQFIKNKLFILTIFELILYKVDDKLAKERCLILGMFTQLPEQVIFAGSLMFCLRDSLINCYLFEQEWIKETKQFQDSFQVTKMVISHNAKRLFVLRKKYGCLMFERKIDSKQTK